MVSSRFRALVHPTPEVRTSLPGSSTRCSCCRIQTCSLLFASPERPAFLFVVSLAAARTKILLSRTEQEIISEFNKYRLDMFH